MSSSKIRLIEFKTITKGNLIGFATITVPFGAAELTITDCPILRNSDKVWASFPAKPQLDADGRQITKGGKKQYASILSWGDRETRERWSDFVVGLARAQHPEAFR